ncbi:hypothetical protein ACSQ67_011333 [Phaseolus vulgaris]
MQKEEGHVHLQHMVMLMAPFTPMIIPPNFFVIRSYHGMVDNGLRLMVLNLLRAWDLEVCISRIFYPFMNFLGGLNDVSGTMCCWANFKRIYVRVPTMGIGIGIVTNVYDENNPTILIVEGVFNAASVGILIYMALVDLLVIWFHESKDATEWHSSFRDC